MIYTKKPANNEQNKKEKTDTTMTILEQRYMETMPMYLKAISESMKMIAESLNKPHDTPLNEDKNEDKNN